jgi:hypothetical protein
MRFVLLGLCQNPDLGAKKPGSDKKEKTRHVYQVPDNWLPLQPAKTRLNF